MADITEKCKQIIQELNNSIKNKEDLEFAKLQVYNLLETFLEEIEEIQENAEKRIDRLVQNQMNLDKRISTIEDDIYEEEGEIEIVCPYCNYEFSADCDELKNEIVCPECNNTIELDWNEEHNCSCCGGECGEDCNCDDYDDDM